MKVFKYQTENFERILKVVHFLLVYWVMSKVLYKYYLTKCDLLTRLVMRSHWKFLNKWFTVNVFSSTTFHLTSYRSLAQFGYNIEFPFIKMTYSVGIYQLIYLLFVVTF